MRFATPSVEVQEKVGGVWRTVWANGIPVKDNRKTDLPPYVHPGPAGASFRANNARIYVGMDYGYLMDDPQSYSTGINIS
jgi:hypothetical protein